jgi:hypothetical protein
MATMNRAQIVETLAGLGIVAQEPSMFADVVVHAYHVWTEGFARGCGHVSSLGIEIGTASVESITETVERCRAGDCTSCGVKAYAAKMAAKNKPSRRRR